MEQLEAWDLSILGQPRHPMFQDPSKVEHLTCKFLNLDFSSVSDREKFNHDLGVALKLRDKDEIQYRKLSGNAEFLSHKPNHIDSTNRMATSPSSRPTSMLSNNSFEPSTRRTSGTAPSHSRFSQSPTFVGSPVLGTTHERKGTSPFPQLSPAFSSDVQTPATPRASPLASSLGPLSVSPVFSNPFSWTPDLETADFLADAVSPATQKPPDSGLGVFPPVGQQSPRPTDLGIHRDNLGWAIHSGDPWFPGKT